MGNSRTQSTQGMIASTGRRQSAVAITVSLLAILLLTGCNARPARPSGALDQLTGSRPDGNDDLIYLQSIHKSGPIREDAWIAVGDVLGDASQELLLIEGSTARILTPGGHQIGGFTLPVDEVTQPLLSDLNGDGKKDIVTGTKNAGSVGLLGFDGQGNTILESYGASMVQGATTPHAAQGGTVYFTASSLFNIAPKIVGAATAGMEAPLWTYHLGQVPTHVDVGTNGLLAISARGVYREGKTVTVPPETNRREHAAIILNHSGELAFYQTIGEAKQEGYFREGAISGVDITLVDIDGDGEDEVVYLKERVSELYGGPTELTIRDLNGSITARRSGPERSDGELALMENNDEQMLLVTWSRHGRIELYDGHLNSLGTRAFPGPAHNLKMRSVGDFDDDGADEILVTDINYLHIVDEDLDYEFSLYSKEHIRDARFLTDGKGKTVLAVLSDRLELFAPENPGSANLVIFTDPPGASVRLDGQLLPPGELPVPRDVTPGIHTIEVSLEGTESIRREIDLPAGMATVMAIDLPEVSGSANGNEGLVSRPPAVPARSYESLVSTGRYSLPEGFRLAAIDDFVGGPEKEYLFVTRNRRTWSIHDQELRYMRSGTFPEPLTGRSFAVYGDLDGDGKSDFGGTQQGDLTRMFAVNGDNRLLFEHPTCRAYGSRLEFAGRTDERLLFTISTGYLLTPRGVYGFDPAESRITFFHPTAGFVNRPSRIQDTFYFGYFAASNGAELVHDDGTVERDSEVFIHAITANGKVDPRTQPLPGQDIDGSTWPFPFDSDNDGQAEPHFLLIKDQYYRGDSGVYRIDGPRGITEVYQGPKDRGVRTLQVASGGDSELLSLRWDKPLVHEVIDASYRLIYRKEYGESTVVELINLDGGPWEIIEYHEGGARIMDFQNRTLETLAIPNTTVIGWRIVDLEGDGKEEIILLGREEIEVFRY
ncbi:MAG: PEGA domain-containing protein [Alkalispirochaeta sp.]